MHKLGRSHRRAIFVGLLGVSMAGCGDEGPQIVPVSGKVIMNGQPLTGYPGFVRVVPANGRAATGKIDPADGSFTLSTYESGDGCLVGSHPTAVIVNTMVGMQLFWLIPERYGDHKTSDLIVTIEGTTEDLKIQLTGALKPAPRRPASSSKILEEDSF